MALPFQWRVAHAMGGGWVSKLELAGAPPFAIRSKEWAVSASAAVAASGPPPHLLTPPRPSSLTPERGG